MRPEINPLLLVLVNIIAWLGFHLVPAAVATALPLHWFKPDGWICRERRYELKGRLYERLFQVRRWKGRLPEGADMLGAGFRKGRLARRDPDYLYQYLCETCRSEHAHIWVWMCGFLFFLWNPPWAGWVMVGYATIANLPCIIAQRYNRLRIHRLLNLRAAPPQSDRGRAAL